MDMMIGTDYHPAVLQRMHCEQLCEHQPLVAAPETAASPLVSEAAMGSAVLTSELAGCVPQM